MHTCQCPLNCSHARPAHATAISLQQQLSDACLLSSSEDGSRDFTCHFLEPTCDMSCPSNSARPAAAGWPVRQRRASASRRERPPSDAHENAMTGPSNCKSSCRHVRRKCIWHGSFTPGPVSGCCHASALFRSSEADLGDKGVMSRSADRPARLLARHRRQHDELM